MDYILGAGLMFAAVLTLAFGRLLLSRSAAPSGDEAFGAAELFAFAFTVLLAFGIATMAAKAFHEATLASLARMAAALALGIAASVAAWIGLGRIGPHGRAALADLSAGDGRGRPQRPSGAGAQGGRKRQAKRAA